VESDARLKGKEKITPRTSFMITFSFAFIVKALCMMSNVMFQVVPMPQVQQFNKLKDTGEVDAAPLMSILYGGCQWCFYGGFAYYITGKSGFLVLVYSNVCGAVLGLYYVWGFHRNCYDPKSQKQLKLYCKAAACVVSTQFLAICTVSRANALFFSGLISSIASVIGSLSLCTTLPKVIQTKSSASINLELLCIGVISSCLWITCGLMLSDIWITVPNFLCLVIQTVCSCFAMIYPRTAEPGGDDAKSSPVSRWLLPGEESASGVEESRMQAEENKEEEEAASSRLRAPLQGRAAAAAATVRAALAAAERSARAVARPGSADAEAYMSESGTGGTGDW